MVYPREKLSPAVFPVFPDDILIDIITRLHVKSLLRFKCVSKHFYAIVDSPYFIRKHHNYAIKSKTSHKIILHSHKAHNFSYHSIDVHLPDQALTLEPPLKSYNGDGTILGSVHGLLCIKVSTKDIIIWNPATKNYRKLPKTLDYEYSTMYFYGFGYNSVFDDYKILRIKQFWDRGTSSYKHIISVYSSRSNSWQFLQDCPYLFSCHLNDQGCGTIICGELLWCVNNSTGYKSPFLIAAFDLATNDFSLVAHPDALNNDFNRTNKKLIDMAISELGGDLCVICYYMHLQVDIWVMRNYRVKESWTKLFSVSKQGILPTFYTPLAYSEKRDEIMMLTGDKSLFWYNKKENKPKIINVHDCPSDGKVQMVICVESLAPPNGRWREE